MNQGDPVDRERLLVNHQQNAVAPRLDLNAAVNAAPNNQGGAQNPNNRRIRIQNQEGINVGMQNAIFGFRVNLDQIRNQNYQPTVKLLKARMCSFIINILCDVFLLYWVNTYLKEVSTASIYVAEKIWMNVWILLQLICYIVAFVAAMTAVCKPRILLNRRWNKFFGSVYMSFLKYQVVVFVSVLFIDVLKFALLPFKYPFKGGDATPDEVALNIIVRVTQGMVGLLVLMILILLC